MVCAYGWGNFTKGNGSLARPLSVIPPVIHHRHPSGLGLPFRVDLSLGSKMLDLSFALHPGQRNKFHMQEIVSPIGPDYVVFQSITLWNFPAIQSTVSICTAPAMGGKFVLFHHSP